MPIGRFNMTVPPVHWWIESRGSAKSFLMAAE
jgi:hypothetical protein